MQNATCIVAYNDRKNKILYIGGDSAGVGDLSVRIRKDPKIFEKSGMLFGYTSSFRMGQLLQYKLVIPGGKIENAILADFYDLNRDSREEWPVSTEVGAWGGAKFVRMIQRHLKRKEKYPSEGPATGMPYEGIENLRPESKAAVQEFLYMLKTPEM